MALHLTVSQIGRGSRQEFRPFALMDERRCVSLSLLTFTNEKRPRYRRLLANTTTPALKARLAEQAEEHERVARELKDELVWADA